MLFGNPEYFTKVWCNKQCNNVIKTLHYVAASYTNMKKRIMNEN